ncbi:arylsulfatase [Sphingomonas laterariae]|uniref:Arylsulfatase n=1 Tax=Edaphosphingomonas laterariae TaxID=861865 RepID=A0A239G855_9SPHN|nr:sulfatase-like hydrolase/transferase [Sphingomonas laterariae]SNS65536.1 arylsulfatase [Sphingomonas laterariae]
MRNGAWRGAALIGLMVGMAGAEPVVAAPASAPAADPWQRPAEAPRGAPNIILILLDDVGFGAPGAFGGPVATPVFDRLSGEGLRFNQFHTTSVCSPTRAALLTGRNQHRVNFAIASGSEVAQPGYNGIWPKSTASMADVLRRNGYSTAAFGKWHNTPNWEASPVGPFDRWPTGLGFEYFYGFMAGEADQWAPILYRNTAIAPTPDKPGYHFTTDIADDATGWIHTHQSLAPDKPYFLYFAPGATHAPHQVPREWIDKYRGRFDQGWDKLREEIFARQKKLGVVPADAKLTPRPAELPSWDSRTPDQKRLAARQMEVYAAFLAHTDHEIGRVVDAARKAPGGDNVMVIYIMGDNGASAEGGMDGSDHNLADIFYGFGAADVATQLARADQLGSDALDNHFAAPWAWATNAPFQWMKQVASHFGGTRNPMVISWPARITDRGALRPQFAHVVDIAPTIYDAVGIAPPAAVDGVAQKSIDGVSFATTLGGKAVTPAHRTQYFEMFGNRAIYRDGWIASARHSFPWQRTGRALSVEDDKWELYDLTRDFSQAVDLAAKYPARVEELKALFLSEAQRNDVLPMVTNIGFDTSKPSLEAGRTSFTFHRDGAPIPSLTGAPLLFGPHRITARITVPAGGADGTIVANGAREGGFALFVEGGRLVYQNNVGGRHWDEIRSNAPLAPGAHDIAFELTGQGAAARGRLSVDGAVVGETPIARVALPSYLGALCVGRTCGTPAARGYKAPFVYGGDIEEVRITRDPPARR